MLGVLLPQTDDPERDLEVFEKLMGFDPEGLARPPVQHKLRVFSDGYQAPSMNGTFRRLMRDSGMALDANGQNRTLYSLRHTYATQELFAGTDIHTLAKQMGTSVLMLERHYSKLTATMAAERLA